MGVRKEAFGARGKETYFLRIKHILILLYIQNKLLSISHPSVAQGSFHSFCLVSFNNSLAANQRKGANYLISTVLFLCDQEMLLTSSHMGIALACHSDPVCSCLEPVLSYKGRRQTTRHQTLLTHGEGELRNLWVQDGTASPGLRLLPDSCHLGHLRNMVFHFLSIRVQILWFPLRNRLFHASSYETPIPLDRHYQEQNFNPQLCSA